MSIRDIDAATYICNLPLMGHYNDSVWVIQYNIDRDHFPVQ